MVILRKILKILEDPKYPSIAPHLYLMSLTGLWHPIRSIGAIIKRALFYITVALLFSQYVRIIIKFDNYSLNILLRYAPFHIGVIKAAHFLKNYNLWEDFITYIGSLEQKQLSGKDRVVNNLVNNYINYNRYVTYLFWTMSLVMCNWLISEFYQNPEKESNVEKFVMFDVYAPFSEQPYAYGALQNMMAYLIGCYIVGWDTLVVAVIIFFNGQLKIAKHYCTNLIDGNNSEISHKNIADFHQHYIMLIKYQKTFNALISPIMFTYLVNVSVNLGFSIIEIFQDKDKAVLNFMYLIACFIQLLFYYWHTNEVTVQSLNVSYGIFESDWTAADLRVQKEAALLCVLTTKRLIFKAGPYNEMTLSTFIGVIKGTYSFYTLLSKTNKPHE
ncbi:odorant receptor 49b-like [Hyposmocoma kahamanoa]|uniref:odorant receptor 49b-like n=1 Tax=Hyposmocoma kahamanoa TaxID=1477025 RepID=UPI000E6D6F82|nr:odorant receptor 49b-like [Hyposmocoma kahamanoa]